MPILALTLWLICFAVAFAGRFVLHARRTGTTGIPERIATRTLTEHAAKSAQLLALGLAVLAPALDLAHVVRPIAGLDRSASHSAGIGLYVVGLAGVAYAQETMGPAFRSGTAGSESSELVMRGPFALVRNPIYAGFIVLQLGLTLLLPSVVAILGLAVQLISTEILVRRVEEPHLAHAHGERYSSYLRRVGRFVPAVGKTRSVATRATAPALLERRSR